MPKVSYTKEAVREAATVRRAARGNHAFTVTNAQEHVSQNNQNLMQRLTLRMLKDSDDPNSVVGPRVSNFVTLPLDNPDVEGHQAPPWSFRMAAEIFSACFPDEVPAPPRRQGGELYYKGDAVPANKEAACRHESMIAAAEAAIEVYEDPSQWINGQVVFASLYYDEGSDFPSLRRFQAELPENWDLAEEAEEVVDMVDGDAPAKAAKESGKATKGKGSSGGRRRRRN